MRHILPRGALVALTSILALALAAPAGAVNANGRLQIIHLDVGQGDGALIISPLGEVAMIDDGPGGTGAMGVSVPGQLQARGVTEIKHHFASHYHSDHIGAIDEIANAGIPIRNGWDRGGSYTTGAYNTYVSTLGSRRRTMARNQVVVLDSLSAHPVTITCVNLAGAGRYSGSEENNLSLVLRVSYGEFDEVFGGDLPGFNSGSYRDIETTVGPQTGPLEVYKVHHHGSATSSNAAWLNAVHPQIGVISLGNGNSYGHPTVDALTRLHAAGVHTYWTETGTGATPNPAWDKVASGQVIISATWEPAGIDTVSGNGFADTFTNSGTALDLTAPVVAVAAPNGGENWEAGSLQDIIWTATDNVGVASIDLTYSTDGGATWPGVIALAVPNTGSYSWTVPDVATASARIRVTARDAAGNEASYDSAADFGITNALSGVGDLALGTDVSLNVYPNPSWAGATRIFCSTPRAAEAQVSIYDIRGSLVRRLGDGAASSGEQTLAWDGRDGGGRDVPSGIYLVRLTAGREIAQTRRLVLFR